MREVVITSAVRPPIGAYCGSLRDVPLERLGAIVINEVAMRAKVKPDQVDDVVMAQSYANGEASNVARHAFFNPPGRMKLVEISRSSLTSDETV
jgi:acetyl-CoA C-acetyltransferase